jgi:ABC-2 type transport system ATP-binding protein
MSTGKLVAQGPVAEVVGGLRRTVRLETDQPEAAAAILRELGLADVRVERSLALGDLPAAAPAGPAGPADGPAGSAADPISGAAGAADVPVDPAAIVATCVHRGLAVTEFQVVRPTLEEAFVALTGDGFDVSG